MDSRTSDTSSRFHGLHAPVAALRYVRPGLDALGVDGDDHLVAHDHAAVIQQSVRIDVAIPAIDLAFSDKAGAHSKRRHLG